MAYRAISVTPISPHVGAEIGDVDLTKPLSQEQVAELHKALTEHLVIFFREQAISHDDHVRLGCYFGKLGKHVGANTISKKTGNPYINQFHYDETSTRISGDLWHT